MSQYTAQKSIEAPDHRDRRGIGIAALFTLTAFTGAALLFIVEPLIAKLLLPEFGGASSVWTLSTFFFQLAMLVGYLFIHFATKLGPRRQPWIQLALVVPALFFLPVALPAIESIPTQEPFARLLLTLTVAIGLPFLVLSTTGPLIQRWYSWTSGPRSDDPYFLYAASNGGSFIGLLAYPFLIEPFISLEAQRMVWSLGFVLFLILVASCGFIVLRQNGKLQAVAGVAEVARESVAKLGLRRQLWWIFLAFLPASLQLGLVSYLTTDVASFPLLWIIPLTIYLATMIFAFGRKSRKPPRWAIVGSLAASIGSLFAIQVVGEPNLLNIVLITSLLMVTLGLISYAAHGALAADRPDTAHLTKYFVLISLGGAIGGAFNGLLAPFIFVDPLEFQLVLVVALALLVALTRERAHRIGVVALIGVLIFATFAVSQDRNSGIISEGRSFYGAWKVYDENGQRVFAHGTTVHGSQSLNEADRKIATAYYAFGGPLNEIVDTAKATANPKITVVGLGSGAMAAYADRDTTMEFIEIDGQVIDVAENPELFSYLSDARGRGAKIVTTLGDGRLKVQDIQNGSQDLIAIDAFSSDSIPVHLLTEEAFEEYAAKLSENGLLAVHISNRVFDLRPVIVANAERLGYRVLEKSGTGDERAKPAKASWMVLTKDDSQAERLLNLPLADHDGAMVWEELTGLGGGVRWTDDHSSIFEVIKG